MNKLFVISFTFFVAATAFAQDNTTGRQTYLYCSQTGNDSPNNIFALKLTNAAVGAAKAIDLAKLVNNDWQQVAKRSILKTRNLTAPMGFTTWKYTGKGFTAIRTAGRTSDIHEIESDTVELQITVRQQVLNLYFKCTTVE